MALNPFFNNQPKTIYGEQALYENLLNEAIQIRGHNVYYIPRESRDEIDWILGEDPTSKFVQEYQMEMYVQNTRDFDGAQDMLSKFGLDIQDNLKFLVTGRTFDRVMNNQMPRPREGDLIYSTLFVKMFEITFVKSDPIFYSLGRTAADRPYLYELACETYKFSYEKIKTGIDEIDQIPKDHAYIIEFVLSENEGNYLIGEEVYVGDGSVQAIVNDWNPTNHTIKLMNIVGEFSIDDILIGKSSTSEHIILGFDEKDSKPRLNIIDNILFENEANSSVDLSETNPFGNSNE